MRTTVTLDDQLLVDVKRVAAETGKTASIVIEDAVRESLARRRAARTGERVELPTFEGRGGLRPGVDLDDTSALLDIMDGLD